MKNLPLHATLLATALTSLPALAADANVGLGLQIGGVSAKADASVKADAHQATQKTRDAAVNAGMGALNSGKGAVESAKAAGQGAANSAKAEAQARAEQAKAAGQAKAAEAHARAEQAKAAGQAKAADAQARVEHVKATSQAKIAAGHQQTATDRISVEDRLAVAKQMSAQQAAKAKTGSWLSTLFGSKADASADLVIGAKLPASASASAQVVSSGSVKGLGAQPRDTELLVVGQQLVRVNAKTRVVLDVNDI